MIFKNKKGFLFTVIVIAIIFLFLIFYLSKFSLEDTKLINKRINTINTFVFSSEQDLERQIYIFGYRSFLIFEKKIISNGEYISNFTDRIDELFYNGTYNGEVEDIMIGAGFTSIQNTLNENGRKINVVSELIPLNLEIYQADPWNIRVELTANLIVRDKGNLAFWNKTEVYYSDIPVTSFHDPLLIVETGGMIIHKINKTPYTTFTSGGDVSNLLDHVSKGYYIASGETPSYLDRIQGGNSSSEFGIESLLYLPELSSQGIIVKPKSVVDHVYFSSEITSDYHIQGMPIWFYLDSDHLSKYNVSSLAY